MPNPGTLKVSKAPCQLSFPPTLSLQLFDVEEWGREGKWEWGKEEGREGKGVRAYIRHASARFRRAKECASALDVRGNDRHISSKGRQREMGTNGRDNGGVDGGVYPCLH